MNDKQPVSFPGWKSALALSNLTPAIKASHTREILTFLHHCKKTRSPVTVALIRQWLAEREKATDGPGHAALRWFYRAAPKPAEAGELSGRATPRDAVTRRDPAGRETKISRDGPAPVDQNSETRSVGRGESPWGKYGESYGQRPPWRPMEPRPAAQDPGGPDWERALVATLRVRGLLARTEDTYRSWAKRFARFIEPKTPYAAAGEEVSAFLTDLAINNPGQPLQPAAGAERPGVLHAGGAQA